METAQVNNSNSKISTTENSNKNKVENNEPKANVFEAQQKPTNYNKQISVFENQEDISEKEATDSKNTETKSSEKTREELIAEAYAKKKEDPKFQDKAFNYGFIAFMGSLPLSIIGGVASMVKYTSKHPQVSNKMLKLIATPFALVPFALGLGAAGLYTLHKKNEIAKEVDQKLLKQA